MIGVGDVIRVGPGLEGVVTLVCPSGTLVVRAYDPPAWHLAPPCNVALVEPERATVIGEERHRKQAEAERQAMIEAIRARQSAAGSLPPPLIEQHPASALLTGQLKLFG